MARPAPGWGGGRFRRLKRARGRDLGIAIAACALKHGASLWTLNPDDFRDMPGLELYDTG